MARQRRELPQAPPGLWERAEMRTALSERDIGTVIRIFRKWTGASQTDISVLTGVPQPDVSDLERGIRHVTALEVFERIADGLSIPRTLLGLAEQVPSSLPSPVAPASPLELRSIDFVEWIADHSNLTVGEAYDRLAARIGDIQNLSDSVRYQRAYARARLTREQLVAALERYYSAASAPAVGGLYRARVGPHALTTSVLTRPGWLQSRVPLATPAEHFQFVPPMSALEPTPRLEGERLDAAIDRLAQAELSTTVLVNNPIYRLLRIALEPARLEAAVTLIDFATYALTMDLLESELVDTLAEVTSQRAATTMGDQRPRLPLRDAYLPSLTHVLDFERRICAGGPVALLAAARPGRRLGQPADYALLVQERSPRVVNVVGRLAVIPKAFHGPTVEPQAEADLSASVHRELEEELLGRDELGYVLPEGLRKVDPFHADLLSEPLRWLLDHQDPTAYQLECVGFGVNLLTGNYEFPCLIVVNDEEWWARFGGQVEANWEIRRVRLYSSRDAAGLQDLMLDPRWSSEGLFAFVEGLRRLAELDTASRVTVPELDAEA
jgi:transcriptional regulator with XRE-family HTH domain